MYKDFDKTGTKQIPMKGTGAMEANTDEEQDDSINYSPMASEKSSRREDRGKSVTFSPRTSKKASRETSQS